VAGNLIRCAIVLAGTLTFTATSYAQVYCQADNTRYYGGAEITVNWTVTAAPFRKPLLPGSTTPSTTCSYSFNSTGGLHRPPELIVKPTLGKASNPVRYRIVYRADKPGRDTFKMRVHFLRGSTPTSAIYTFNVTVTDRAI
jgi:hypothetical protein